LFIRAILIRRAISHIDDRFDDPETTAHTEATQNLSEQETSMIHFVLHDAGDTVAVVVVEGVKAGTDMTGWIMDEDRTVEVRAQQDIPIGHKVALRDMSPGDTVVKYGIDMGKVVAPAQKGQHAHVHNIKTKRW
jgi:(2R)-sulfolactate sulfo-lyase subunit alpha